MKNQRIIGLEEHFITPEFERMETDRDTPHAWSVATMLNRVENLGEERISEMDAAGIDVQIISLTAPGTQPLGPEESVELSRKTNDILGMATQKYSERLAGFATLPTILPEEAALELRRTVTQYGFKGAVINGHTQERYLDDPFFDPILAEAERLNVPIYLHPTEPPKAVTATYYTGHFSSDVTAQFSTAGWGWHIETAVHLMRMILGGVFDKHPGLRVITGHLGEGMLYAMKRMDQLLPKEMTGLNYLVSDYMKTNIYYTISGYNFEPQFMAMYQQVGVNQIMFSCDYPYVSMEKTRTFVENLPISEQDKQIIFSGNAERLFHI